MLLRLTIKRFIRLLAIAVFAVLLGFVLPNITSIGNFFFEFTALPVVMMFAFLIGFLINRAIERAETIIDLVEVELSRIRRTHHIAEQLKNVSGYKKWFEEMDQSLKEYLQEVGNGDFYNYSKAGESFRQMSHLIYNLKPKQAHHLAIYNELLVTTREIALVRQDISSELRHKIAPYAWVILFSVSITLLFLVYMANVATVQSNFMTSISTGAILLVMEFLWQLDNLDKADRQELSNRYIQNFIKLD